ncbi:peptidase M48 Ste24p [Pyrolobus fumarii 1A]|uniref:Protease HtpX homolog n=1 Tax=Pyrolobus fumarii (strain DSM 11204 / 1A) TaxID=694429 RepID=G0EGQ0_PYRF1|nr:peptidase M48 Ste24p [Pyrolobus fumarii 1A]
MLWVVGYWLEMLVLGLVLGLVVGLAANSSVVRGLLRNPRSLGELRLMMIVIAVATVLVGVGLVGLVAEYLGLGVTPALLAAGVAVFMLLQWLFSPVIINAIYGVHEAGPELEWLRVEVERLARESGLRSPPKLVVADMDAPNAFAYGSPLFGNYVAVTRGLLHLLPREEIIAVIGHEIGHLKHRDVVAILALATIPAIVYFMGRALLHYAWWAGGSRDERASPATLFAVGAALVALGFLLHLVVQHFSRLREYYADAHSALVTGAPRLLQRALARLYAAYHSVPRYRDEISAKGFTTYLFIVSGLLEPLYTPWSGDIDTLVEELKRTEPSVLEELFSTHPPIPKRLRFLDALAERLSSL